ncbi:MAG: ornithine cyclodeaminase family protein [Actinobacteria bacterium]|nr:ornithine cyclodeaminase family protein [Actinomycetota bacterium]
MRFLDARAVREGLSLEGAVDALSAAFATVGKPTMPQRPMLEAPAGSDFLIMPATGAEAVGAKVITINPANPARGQPLIQGVFLLFGGESLAPVAVLDAGALTSIRTAAVSALATRLMARPDASNLVIFGAGVQARAHLEAMVAVRPIERVTIVDRDRDRARELAAGAAGLAPTIEAGDADSVGEAHLVCTCTTSPRPVFDGAKLMAGAHVNAMGSYKPSTAEVDETLVKRAWIAVETREAALAEAGDLLQPIASGAITEGSIAAELADLASGRIKPPEAADVTLFKSVGIAFEDLVVAAALLERREREG